jgi:hypothetical protein
MLTGILGAIVRLAPPSEDSNVWEATQTEVAHHLPPGDVEGRKEISWSFGPVNVCISSPFSDGTVPKKTCP